MEPTEAKNLVHCTHVISINVRENIQCDSEVSADITEHVIKNVIFIHINMSKFDENEMLVVTP